MILLCLHNFTVTYICQLLVKMYVGIVKIKMYNIKLLMAKYYVNSLKILRIFRFQNYFGLKGQNWSKCENFFKKNSTVNMILFSKNILSLLLQIFHCFWFIVYSFMYWKTIGEIKNNLFEIPIKLK